MGNFMGRFKKDETWDTEPLNEEVPTAWPSQGFLRSTVLFGLVILVIVSILLHGIDSLNDQNVATTIGGMFLGLGLLLTMWISVRSENNGKARRTGDGEWDSNAGKFRNYMINYRLLIICLFFFGILMATWYMAQRHQRPLSQRYTILVPSVVLCLVIWLRYWNGRDGQVGNAKEIPLIIFMLNLFGIVYAFTALIDNQTTTTWLWIGLLIILFLVLFARTMWDWHKRRKSDNDLTDEQKAAATAEKVAKQKAEKAAKLKVCVGKVLELKKKTGDANSGKEEPEEVFVQRQVTKLQECWGESDVLWTSETVPKTLREAAEKLAAKLESLGESDGENTATIEQFQRVISEWGTNSD